MEDLHGKWENSLSPTARITIRVIKTVFYQAKTSFCLLRIATALQRGEIPTYRAYLRKLSHVITLRGFACACTDALDDLNMTPPHQATPLSTDDVQTVAASELEVQEAA
jgi:hypothetical protein